MVKHGPLAVTSANRSGEPAATTCDDAQQQLGTSVRVYLDGGTSAERARLDDRRPHRLQVPRVLRVGAIPVARLREVVPELLVDEYVPRTDRPATVNIRVAAASGEIAIDVRDLRKRYGDTIAVDGLTFQVEVGEFFGILGPNGAGKTTTLEIIEGIRQADAGDVTVLGERPWPRNPVLLPQIGVQLQASAFFEKLTAREQLETFAALYGVPRPARTICSTWSG